MVPTNPFILFLGGAELLQLATRLGERLTSSQTVLATLSKNGMGFVCDFDGAGFYLVLLFVRGKVRDVRQWIFTNQVPLTPLFLLRGSCPSGDVPPRWIVPCQAGTSVL